MNFICFFSLQINYNYLRSINSNKINLIGTYDLFFNILYIVFYPILLFIFLRFRFKNIRSNNTGVFLNVITLLSLLMWVQRILVIFINNSSHWNYP